MAGITLNEGFGWLNTLRPIVTCFTRPRTSAPALVSDTREHTFLATTAACSPSEQQYAWSRLSA